jgi:hypothetical protein
MINPFSKLPSIDNSSHLAPLFIPRTMSSSDVEMPGSSNSYSKPGTLRQICVAPDIATAGKQGPERASPRGRPARLYKDFRHLAARGRIWEGR